MSIFDQELVACFRFFYEQANHDIHSKGFGLIRDNTKETIRASIASVGFGLSMYVIGVENGYLSKEEAILLVKGTFHTFLEHVDHFHGFFPHFLEMDSAKRYKKCEYSTIDSVLFYCGAITCDSYFDDAEIHTLFNRLFERWDFNPFIKTYQGKQVVTMAYNPLTDGDYRGEDSPWIYQWSTYAEQLAMYVLAAATDNVSDDLAQTLYNNIDKTIGSYGDYKYIYCPSNALFTYQYAHAWVDFGSYLATDSLDWFENSRIATLANRQFCIDHKDIYPIFNEHAWGLTAGLTPKGYRNQCILPNPFKDPENHIYGVLTPSGPIGSLPFSPIEVHDYVSYIITRYPDSFGHYGFADGIAEQNGSVWISDDYIGINKGISGLMIANYQSRIIWDVFMKHPLIQKAIQKLNFRKK
ncbi:MAG: hypothetical protein JXB08_03285 [Bacilli bacterium]|nr:hypothetical protein [Bacilli bacterium]MBN2876313.1 hypothetical protein [Bacilli bacterium]